MSSELQRGATRAARIDLSSVVSCAANIPSSRLHDDVLVMDALGGYCYSLNVSAARIWDLIVTPTPVGAICAVLCKEFAIDPESCAQDVSEVLAAMREAGLIKVTDAARD